MINSRQKGKRGELALVKMLNERGFSTRRSVQYNGKAEDGDADVVGLDGIHIECKAVERLNIHEAMEQAEHDRRIDAIPVVMHKKNRKGWLVTMNLEDWLDLYEKWMGKTCIDQFEEMANGDS